MPVGCLKRAKVYSPDQQAKSQRSLKKPNKKLRALCVSYRVILALPLSAGLAVGATRPVQEITISGSKTWQIGLLNGLEGSPLPIGHADGGRAVILLQTQVYQYI
jgi:hypothetical protein